MFLQIIYETENVFIRFSSLLPPDLGRHSVGSVLSDGRWERANPNGHRLRYRPSSGSSAQSPGGQSSGMIRYVVVLKTLLVMYKMDYDLTVYRHFLYRGQKMRMTKGL